MELDCHSRPTISRLGTEVALLDTEVAPLMDLLLGRGPVRRRGRRLFLDEYPGSMLPRVIANAAAVFVAAVLVPGIRLGPSEGLSGLSQGNDGLAQILTALAVGLIFGFVNAVVKPLTQLLSLPFIILTLGLFLLVINMMMFMLTSQISGALGLGFAVQSWTSAFFGAIIVSIVSSWANGLFKGRRRK